MPGFEIPILIVIVLAVALFLGHLMWKEQKRKETIRDKYAKMGMQYHEQEMRKQQEQVDTGKRIVKGVLRDFFDD